MDSLSDKQPNLGHGIDYWNSVSATYDGVLGGFGEGTLPRVDSLGSRQFLLGLLPELCTVPSALRPVDFNKNHRWRALDVGAGVGRVTSDVLLHLCDDVVLLEPVEKFVNEAKSRAQLATSRTSDNNNVTPWAGLSNSTKSVTFLQGTLQSFAPLEPSFGSVIHKETLGYNGAAPQPGFDVIWCQWCLGHLSDEDLVNFFIRMKQSLRNPHRSLIVVKENLCSDGPNGEARSVFDGEDSSLTRSNTAWKSIFSSAGLELVTEKIQEALPAGLYLVKMYALRSQSV